jgi:hypothetical protein
MAFTVFDRRPRNCRRCIVGTGFALVLACVVVGRQLAMAPYGQPGDAISSAPLPRARVQPAAIVHWPLKVSASGRYLVDRRGKPFLIIGDAPQALVVNLSEAEADKYLSDRQAGNCSHLGSTPPGGRFVVG